MARRALTVEDGTREGKLSAPRAVLAGTRLRVLALSVVLLAFG